MVYTRPSDALDAVRKRFPNKELMLVPVAAFGIAYSISERESLETVAELLYTEQRGDKGNGLFWNYKLVYKS